MSTLSTMFPSFDESTLKSVLYETNGHLERTIEILLQMVDDIPSSSSSTPPIQPSLISDDRSSSQNQHRSTVGHNLPDDFLRYSDMVPSQNDNNIPPTQARDDVYAYRLQEALYQQGFQDTPPVMPSHYYESAAQVDAPSQNRYHSPHEQYIQRNVGSSYSSAGIGMGSSGNEGPSTFDQLSDFAKKKFGEFKKKLFTNRTTNATPAHHPPRNDDDEGFGLLSDEDNSRL